MGGDAELLELAKWRRQTAELYAAVRGAAEAQAEAACIEFRRRRNDMFASHPQSPLDAQQKKAFRGLSYFRNNPALRFRVPVLPPTEAPANGAGNGELIVDFNYAYNPSCAYNPRWVCPLSPAENTLHAAVEAGELAF